MHQDQIAVRLSSAPGAISPLRRLRKAAGLTQADVAAAISRSQSYLSSIESGEVHPTATDISRLNTLLGVDLSVHFEHLRSGRA